ncbi:uncharacterized protein LOC141822856 [Curcuma longa]|uniref:uncharacterized protein LOC141822856 n=1 Tax=Curcuma longa TaxID=136217 RepID=UPI003D9F90EF
MESILRPPHTRGTTFSSSSLRWRTNAPPLSSSPSAGRRFRISMGFRCSSSRVAFGLQRAVSKARARVMLNSSNVFDQSVEAASIEEKTSEMLDTDTPLKYSRGVASPLGVSVAENGINFAVFSRHATRVSLCLSKCGREDNQQMDDGMLEVPLDPQINKTGDVWHICIEGLLRSGIVYGYRIDGPQGWGQGHRFDSSVILLDPYAKLVSGRKRFGDVTDKMSKFLGTYDFTSSPFDWGPDYKLPNIPETDLVIYEMNVRAFTADGSSGLDPEICGSYLGVIEKYAAAPLLLLCSSKYAAALLLLYSSSMLLLPSFSFMYPLRCVFHYHLWSTVHSSFRHRLLSARPAPKRAESAAARFRQRKTWNGTRMGAIRGGRSQIPKPPNHLLLSLCSRPPREDSLRRRRVGKQRRPFSLWLPPPGQPPSAGSTPTPPPASSRRATDAQAPALFGPVHARRRRSRAAAASLLPCAVRRSSTSANPRREPSPLAVEKTPNARTLLPCSREEEDGTLVLNWCNTLRVNGISEVSRMTLCEGQ